MSTVEGVTSKQATTLVPEQEESEMQEAPTGFTSSLSYTNVRDFAYPPTHPLHYGPAPIPSAAATPSTTGRNSGLFSGAVGWWTGPEQSHHRRSSDPSGPNRGHSRDEDAADDWRDPRAAHNQPPPLKFADGPPWFEDEDLASPVIVSNRHRKHKSSIASLQGKGSRDERSVRDEKGRLLSVSEIAQGGENGSVYHNGEMGEHSEATTDLGEPGGTYSTTTGEYMSDEQGDDDEDYEDSDEEYDEDDSRFSKDYHFSIASPDEEMHGKAVALFDFTRENDNELGLLEGQVIWVSYRHGQGWLVAEDPKTGESGLVPEEYVRLFREIPDHNASIDEAVVSPTSTTTTTPFHSVDSNTSNGNTKTASPPQTSVTQSHFSTSSQDLEKYPHTKNLHPDTSLPPIISRDSSRPPPMDRTQSQKSDSAMDIDNVTPSSLSSIEREHFTMQQRKLADGKVLNGKEKGEQQEYQSLHHKNPSLSGAVTPAEAT